MRRYHHKIKHSRIFSSLFWVVFLTITACNPTKYVPKGDYLLENYKIEQTQKKVDKSELESYVKQKPNKRIIGFRFHLSMYNLANPGKDNWFNNWLRTIGEEPVIFDEIATEKTTNQLRLYMRNKGYYDARVTDSVILKKKTASVIYRIKPNVPYRIRNISYYFEDTTLRDPVLKDTVNSLIHRGGLFDMNVLQQERERIETMLKNKGYYNFSKEFIYFDADTALINHKVDLEMGIKKYVIRNRDNLSRVVDHKKYKIRNVSINMNYEPGIDVENEKIDVNKIDTLKYDGLRFLYVKKPLVKPQVLAQSDYILPGDLYRLDNVTKTYNHLSSLRLFKFVNMQFYEVEKKNSYEKADTGSLDCVIQLSPYTLQSYTVEVEGTNSSGNLGIAGNVIYQHKNLFGGAEALDFKIKGAIETLQEAYGRKFNNTLELGTEAKISIPKFLLPFRTEGFIKKFNPKTLLTIAYNYQRRPDYTRTIANASFGYYWHGNRYLNHTVNPIEINLVKLPSISSTFKDQIAGTYLENSYQQHLVAVSNYSFTFNNQNIKKNTDFMYFRFNFEEAGNLLTTFNDLIHSHKVDGSYQLFGTQYSQYLKSDIDYRYYQQINESDKLVYRFFAGAAYPYGNAKAIPFEKEYFGGGANGIRAWQVRNLGPGSYHEETPSAYPNKMADMKLEANLEYRFKLFWVLEGALFMDAGNIWAITSADERPGALFKWNKFYKDIAIGAGAGTRFDFSFFIFRFDVGLKLRDPSLPSGSRWIPGSRPLTAKDFGFNIGIGYPF